MNEQQFFDWLRNHQDDKLLNQQMVDGANELIALVGIDKLKESLAKINCWQDIPMMSLSDNGFTIIEEFEGFRSQPYRCSAGRATIGIGMTYYPNGTKVTMQDKPITIEQARTMKQEIINRDFVPAINMMFADEIANGKISQNMFDALVSLAYNIGTRGLAGSSVYRHIKQGDYKKAGDAFLLWNKARVKGRLKVVKGLALRRQKERDLFNA